MNHSLCLITAALLAAQAPGGRVEAVPVGAEPAIVSPAPGCNCGNRGGWQSAPAADGPQAHPGLLPRLAHRIRGLFGGDEQSEPAPVIQGEFYPAQPARAGGVIEEQSAPVGPVDQEPPLAVKDQPGAAPRTTVQGQPQKIQVIDGDEAQGVPVIEDPQPNGAPAVEGDVAPGAQVLEQPAAKLPAQAGHDEQYHRITGRLAFLPSGGGTWMVRYADHDADRFGGLVELSTAARMDGLHSGDLVTVEGEVLNTGASPGPDAPIFRATTVRLVEHAR